jgi:hypothetical protein
MDDIEEVAQAIRSAHTEVIFGETNDEAWRRLARAAIDALNLVREYKYLEDGWGGQTIHADGTTTHDFKLATRTSRLVGPWRVDNP